MSFLIPVTRQLCRRSCMFAFDLFCPPLCRQFPILHAVKIFWMSRVSFVFGDQLCVKPLVPRPALVGHKVSQTAQPCTPCLVHTHARTHTFNIGNPLCSRRPDSSTTPPDTPAMLALYPTP